MKWIIPVTWEMCDSIIVEAPTLEEAIKTANTDASIPLPFGDYVDGSFGCSYDNIEEVRELHNCNQPDDTKI